MSRGSLRSELGSGVGLSLPEYLVSRRCLVEEGIVDFLGCHYDGQVMDIVGYTAQGGKRLRGILAMLICETLGGTATAALPAAVAVELAQAASLAHDDIIDGDLARRGRAALHARYDLAMAILVPHLIVPHAVLSAQEYGPEALRVILEGWARVTQGQVRDYLPPDLDSGADLTVRGEGALGSAEREYWAIVRDKTAALFETAAVLGVMAAADGRHAAPAREYAAWLGNAFQVADDVADLEQGADRPWAVILGPQGARSMGALRQMFSENGDDVVTAGAIGQARQLVSRTVERCLSCVELFPDSPLRELLRAFPAFAVARIHGEAGDVAPSSYRSVSESPWGGA